ncbi:MAG TPA: amino acid adenylation domain-containing protein [Novosphingobium sp.]
MSFVAPDALASMISCAFRQHEDETALELGGHRYSYADLWRRAKTFASAHRAEVGLDGAIGILPGKSLEAYVAVLGAILLRRPYVALNMKFPLERQLHIAQQSRCRVIVADAETESRRAELLAELNWSDPSLPCEQVDASLPAVEDIAYYIFTSGTTGRPKGVVVSRGNLAAYIDEIHQILGFPVGIRCTQFFDFSFDVSVHDMFYTWYSGGTLCPMLPEDGTDHIAFAKAKRIQSWYSVPSVLALAERTGGMVPNALPDLRWSMFAGEALPSGLARRWLSAAPNSKAFNLYGPTEATITVTAQAFDRESLTERPYPTVPIGTPHDRTDTILVNPDTMAEADGTGELWVGGPQVVIGYLNNAEETAKRFVDRAFPGHQSERWYRTGDLVERSADDGYVFLGRLDDQVKIRGYRAELLEIEEVLRVAVGSAEAAIVPWPITSPGCAEGIVGFVAGDFDEASVLQRCAASLPNYLVPAKLIRVPALPLNQNGKVDRKALRTQFLEQPATAHDGSEASPAELERRLVAAWTGLFPKCQVTAQSSFVSLHADSLSYVNALLAAEDILGALPADWVDMPIADLVTAVRPQKSRFGVRVDTPIAIRAAAITFVMFGHLGYTKPLHTGMIAGLMLLSGYFFGALQLSDINSPNFARRLMQPVVQIVALYYLLILPLLFFVRTSVGYVDIFLLQDIVNPGQDFPWFIAALIHITLVVAAITPLAQRVSKWAKGRLSTANLVLMVLIGVGLIAYAIAPFLLPPSETIHDYEAPRWWRYSFPAQMLVFGTGAMLGRRDVDWGRAAGVTGVFAIVFVSVWFGYFDQAGATLLAAGALLFLKNLRMPQLLARATYAVADASLFLYLLQPPIAEFMQAHDIKRRFILVTVFVVGLSTKWAWDNLSVAVRNIRVRLPAIAWRPQKAELSREV